jgi:hypothetical protein
MAYLNVKCRAKLRNLVQDMSNAYSILSTYDDSAFKPQQEIPKKQQFDITPPQVSNDFSQLSTDSPHSSHPNLVIRFILDYSDDPEPSPTKSPLPNCPRRRTVFSAVPCDLSLNISKCIFYAFLL